MAKKDIGWKCKKQKSKTDRQTDRYADRQKVKASHPADLGSFRAQQIR